MEQTNEKKIQKLVMNKMHGIKAYMVLSFVICIVLQLVELIPPVLMQRVIDDYIPDGQIKLVLLSIIAFVGIPILITAGNAMYQYMLNVIARRYGQELTLWGAENLLKQPMSYFDHHNSSELVTYCKADAVKYVVLLLFDIPQILAKICGGVIVMALIARINIWLALIVLLYIPFAYFPSVYFADKIEQYVTRVVSNNAKLTQVMNDTFRGVRFVKAMCLEKWQLKKIRDINTDTIRIWGVTSALDNLNGAWASGFMSNLFTGVVFGIAAYLIICGNITLGSLMIILNYLPRVFSVVSAVTDVNFNYKKQMAEFAPLFEIILMQDQEEQNAASEMPPFSKEIRFEDVCFSYNREQGEVLKNLRFHVKKGSWTGIIGASGAGKSTIFDLLMGFIRADRGHIWIDDRLIEDIGLQSLRREITLVSQTPFLFPGTVRENLELIREGVSEQEMLDILSYVGLKERIAELESGLNTEVGENGAQLSGGEMQRLSLAQGLLRGSSIMLLDEVTASVDEKTQRDIQQILCQLMREKGVTIISISHRLEFLSEADQILYLKDGKFVDEPVDVNGQSGD